MTTSIRPLRADDLDTADRVFRVAFGTFLGLPDPAAFAGDADYVKSRWRANPAGAFAAEHHGSVVGSVFAACWGTVGFFGPLSVLRLVLVWPGRTGPARARVAALALAGLVGVGLLYETGDRGARLVYEHGVGTTAAADR